MTHATNPRQNIVNDPRNKPPTAPMYTPNRTITDAIFVTIVMLYTIVVTMIISFNPREVNTFLPF